MTRRELVLRKLQEIPDSEMNKVIHLLTLHVKARLRYRSLIDRTKTGAHGQNNLGMNAIEYYVGESIKKLFDSNGWDWKFEELTLTQQLTRIANKLITDKVSDYKNKKKKDGLPKFKDQDIGDLFDVSDSLPEVNHIEQETTYAKLIEFAIEQSKEDDNLHYFTIRYFEDAKYETIAVEMNISIEQVYALRKKLVRRLMQYKKELTA